MASITASATASCSCGAEQSFSAQWCFVRANASAEAAITSAGVGETGGMFKIGTIDATVEGLRYAVEYADVLGGEWTVHSVSEPGEGQKLILEAPLSPTGDHRFYRLVVTDAE